MGKRRIRNLQYLQAGEIIGFDPRPDRQREAQERYGIRAFSRFDDAMAFGPEALIISTPPDLHTHYARIAALNGKHFFTEASVVDEGMDEVITLSRGKNFVAAPSCTMRFHPLVQIIRDIKETDSIGKILTFTYHSGQYLPDWHPWEDYRTFYVAKRETGACREIVPFELVWLTWIMGPVQQVSCFKDKLTKLDARIDDVYQLLLRFESEAIGHLMVDVISRVPYRICRFLGEEGVVEWLWTEKIVRVFSARTRQWQEYREPEGKVEKGYIHAETMYIREMQQFLQAIKKEEPYPYTFEEDQQLLQVLYTAEKSAITGRHLRLFA
jgi:predicted dehydrogenase